MEYIFALPSPEAQLLSEKSYATRMRTHVLFLADMDFQDMYLPASCQAGEAVFSPTRMQIPIVMFRGDSSTICYQVQSHCHSSPPFTNQNSISHSCKYCQVPGSESKRSFRSSIFFFWTHPLPYGSTSTVHVPLYLECPKLRRTFISIYLRKDFFKPRLILLFVTQRKFCVGNRVFHRERLVQKCV
jgi:hypothetical protein